MRGLEPGGVDDLDLLASELHQALLGEALEQAADDLAHAAELVGELLVGDVQYAAFAEQQRRQALVELAEGDLLDGVASRSAMRSAKRWKTKSRKGRSAIISSNTAFGSSISRVSDSVTPRAL